MHSWQKLRWAELQSELQVNLTLCEKENGRTDLKLKLLLLKGQVTVSYFRPHHHLTFRGRGQAQRDASATRDPRGRWRTGSVPAGFRSVPNASAAVHEMQSGCLRLKRTE